MSKADDRKRSHKDAVDKRDAALKAKPNTRMIYGLKHQKKVVQSTKSGEVNLRAEAMKLIDAKAKFDFSQATVATITAGNRKIEGQGKIRVKKTKTQHGNQRSGGKPTAKTSQKEVDILAEKPVRKPRVKKEVKDVPAE